MATEKVNIQFGADTGPLRAGVQNAQRILGGLKNTASTLMGALGLALSVRAVTQFGGSAIRAAAEFEGLKNALASVAKGGESVSDLVAMSKELAKMPGLGLNEVISAFIQLKSTGTGTNEAARIIKEIGNAVVSSGGGINQFALAIKAISQMQGVGKVLGGDLNQLKNAVPSIGAAMKEAFGTTVPEAMKESDKEAGAFLDKLLKILEAGPRVEGGLQNQIDNLADSWRDAKVAVGEFLAILTGPAMQKAMEALQALGGPSDVQGWKPDPLVAEFKQMTKDRADANKRFEQAMLNGPDAAPLMQSDLPSEKARQERAKLNFQSKPQKLTSWLVDFALGESASIDLEKLNKETRGTSPFSPVVASSLASIGGGGGVFGGSRNPAYDALLKQKQVLENQLTFLQKIEENTGEPINMRP